MLVRLIAFFVCVVACVCVFVSLCHCFFVSLCRCILVSLCVCMVEMLCLFACLLNKPIGCCLIVSWFLFLFINVFLCVCVVCVHLLGVWGFVLFGLVLFCVVC